MDTKIGNFNLTAQQRAHAFTLITRKVKSIGIFQNGDVIVSHADPLTHDEITQLGAAVQALPDAPTAQDLEKKDFQANPMLSLTPAQAEAWIENNVNNLADAKTALKRLAKLVIYMLRRQRLN